MNPHTNYELDWLKQWKQYSPDAVALKDGDTGREVTYAQLFAAASTGAAYLKSQFQIQAGDRVAILSLNELEYVFLFFALQRLGATLVPINYRLTQREVEHIVSDCTPKLVVYQAEYASIVSKLNHPCGKVLLNEIPFFNSSSATHLDFESKPETAAMIIYTSGTTGAPKGALISHQMIFWNSVNTTLRLNISQTDSTVIFLPFFHTGGWNVLTTPFLHRGAKIVLLKKFDGEQILALSEKEKATLLFGVPTTMDMMARSPNFEKVNLSTIRYGIVGGEPMPIELIHKWHGKGIPIRQGYGLTEFGPNVFSLNEQDALRKIGSIGFANFYAQAKVVGESGQELGANQIGELWLKGPMCMTGYWNNPKATAETITDGWLHTGDLVRRDEEGYYYVVGRKKEMFKSGGENVYPAELEKVIRSLPGIREVAVIGVPDSKWGEVGKAFISCEQNVVLTETFVAEHCLQNLAKFKVPKYFQFLPELPKGESGKILKRKLAELSAQSRT
jgi:fatty-acyl-CoA synthase